MDWPPMVRLVIFEKTRLSFLTPPPDILKSCVSPKLTLSAFAPVPPTALSAPRLTAPAAMLDAIQSPRMLTAPIWASALTATPVKSKTHVAQGANPAAIDDGPAQHRAANEHRTEPAIRPAQDRDECFLQVRLHLQEIQPALDHRVQVRCPGAGAVAAHRLHRQPP